ncbi:MAG: LysM peptidoglycan-binding domain-containing protein [Syntrophaceticus sp.]|nr:LysM peptidoglycan-binding domain-containing protein [Syntrophaceticus sp.]
MNIVKKRFLPVISTVLICGLLFPGISEAATHTVKSGDTLWGIANRYSTTVAKLQQLNNISGSLIYPGQALRVDGQVAQKPAPTTPKPAEPSKPSGTTYTVKSGDSLWAIANRHKTTVAKLQQLNNISGSLIYPGQKLRVDGQAAQTPAPTPAPAPSNPKPSEPSITTYTVKSGDSLWAIANRHNITVAKLRQLNNISGSLIYPGQKLKVSGQASGNPSRGSSSSIIQTAKRYLGVRYDWGGTSSSGFDCSGLVQVVYSANGIKLPRVADDQAKAGTKIWSMSQLQPGDLVCFSGSGNGYISHIGIYIGNNQIIHASSTSTVRKVVVDSLSGSWFKRTFAHGTRVL